MIRSLATAATGMQAQEQRLEQISSNLANMNTTAFKKGRTEFQDLMYQTIKDAGGTPGVNEAPVGIQVGSGVKVSAQYTIHDQGPSKMTRGLFDLLINGEGFFQVQLPNGSAAYTRDGSFKMDSQGRLVTSNGYSLVPNIQIPQGTAGVTITGTGEVRAMTSQGQESVIGQIQLVNFLNPAAMHRAGESLMTPVPAAGAPVVGVPGEGNLGTIQQGALEMSNVNPTEEIIDLIAAQRGFEMNSKVVTTAEKILESANNMGTR